MSIDKNSIKVGTVYLKDVPRIGLSKMGEDIRDAFIYWDIQINLENLAKSEKIAGISPIDVEPGQGIEKEN